MELKTISPLLDFLLKQKIALPSVFEQGPVKVVEGEVTSSVSDADALKRLFPDIFGKKILTFKKSDSKVDNVKNIGVILSGGQAPGGHNVICGIFDALKATNPSKKLYGFLGGPSGIVDGNYMELTDKIIDQYRNTGGFDIIGSGRTKLEKEQQFEKAKEVCNKLGIDTVVIIGGDDSNTNAALMAQYMLKNKVAIKVIGVPKTIDGDLKNQFVETSFGFDTAAKVYSEIIGNIQKDANSAKKYWHFIKLMGRSASHITLEVALQTHCNYAAISEEVKAKNITLDQLVKEICDIVIKRANNKKNFGVVLIPEGLIEFIPEMNKLISELNNILAENETYFKTLNTFEAQTQFINHHLSQEASYTFSSLPADIQMQLLEDRDDHGNVSVSKIETEKLLIELCTTYLNELKTKGEFTGKFSPLHHFLGYEGRCAAPTPFDSKYCYALGFSAFNLANSEMSGYIAYIKNCSKPVKDWIPGGVPLTMLMNMEERRGQLKPVIQKALVELDGKPFKTFEKARKTWAVEDDYRFPGPIQYFGPAEICDVPTLTLLLEHKA